MLPLLAVLVAILNLLCFVLLGGLGLLIAFWNHGSYGNHGEPNPGFQKVRRVRTIRRCFLLLALSLIVWQLTLFLEAHSTLPLLQLYLGRANFTAIVFVVYFAHRFVQEIGRAAGKRHAREPGELTNKLGWFTLAETIVLAGVTLLTSLVDADERVIVGSHGIVHPISRFGSLFPLYLVHVFSYWSAAVVLAFFLRSRAHKARSRRQLMLIGVGILVTGGIAAVTNAYLPYAFDDFRFCQIGTLATLFFIAAVAYAVFIHNLFDLGVVLRETLVFGILLTFVLGAYSSTVFLVTQFLTEGAGKAAQFVVVFIAFSFDPLRRYLEKKTDRFLFGQDVEDAIEGNQADDVGTGSNSGGSGSSGSNRGAKKLDCMRQIRRKERGNANKRSKTTIRTTRMTDA